MKFPIRPLPYDFVPKSGGHAGVKDDKNLCVMEALNWAQGDSLTNDRPPCVSHTFRSLFISLNDHFGPLMRAELFKRVHRLLGTDRIPSQVTSCLSRPIIEMLNIDIMPLEYQTGTGPERWRRLPETRAEILSRLDTALDSIDAWCAENNPRLAALRAEVPPLSKIGPRRRSFLSHLTRFFHSKSVTKSSLPPTVQAKINYINSQKGDL